MGRFTLLVYTSAVIGILNWLTRYWLAYEFYLYNYRELSRPAPGCLTPQSAYYELAGREVGAW